MSENAIEEGTIAYRSASIEKSEHVEKYKPSKSYY